MRKRSIAGQSLLLVAVASSAFAAERSGEDVYAAACAACHGSDGRGASPAQTGLSLEPLDFTDCLLTNREPDQDWRAVIAEGGPARGFHRMMPAFGEVLSEAEQEAVLGYVRGFCTEPAYPRGDLNFPRPLVTEKAFVEDEFVLSTAVATRSPRNVASKLVYEQRFLRRQQFEVIVPFGVAKMADGSREAGIGDVAVGAKSALFASVDTGSILSVAGEVALPTGNKDKGFGKGVVVLEPFLAFGQALPADFFLHLQAGAEIPIKEASDVETEGFLRGALGTSLTSGKFGRTFSPMVEAFAARELASDAPTFLDIVPQLQVSLSRRQHILANLGASIPTLRREGRFARVLFYLLWDWYDGGFFEGW
ncbi:MAG: c-type cytochrome [Deltaproteobacteria bacterium]|nr:c-type cytochrome [Deltaproteobacteria bacterium]